MPIVEFTSGQASGACDVPLPTIRRYVLTFPDVFSSTAKIRSKGRRFLPADIEAILKIRRLFAKGLNTAEVRKALTDGFDPDHVTRRDVIDSVNVLYHAQDLLSRTQDDAKKMRYAYGDLELKIKTTDRDFAELYNRVDTLQSWMARAGKKLDERLVSKFFFVVSVFFLGIAVMVTTIDRGWLIAIVTFVFMVLALWMAYLESNSV